MKVFNVEITETLRRSVTVQAHDEREAYNKVCEAWIRSEYVLDADDFLEAGFEVIGIVRK